MSDLNNLLREKLQGQGADLLGFADLSALPGYLRHDLAFGISVAVKYPKAVIRGIEALPTPAYRDWYNKLNQKLDHIVSQGALFLRERGYRSQALSRAEVRKGSLEESTLLPHKTIATRAGLGWIGKCALLVTERYGSMIRLSSILTEAPLETAAPVNQSRCGDCAICTLACPAAAASGKLWEVNLARDDFFDVIACRETAIERSKRGFGGDGDTICGKCIVVCPWTRRYLES